MFFAGRILEVTKENIQKILDSPEKYAGYCFVVDCPRSRRATPFLLGLLELVKSWRHRNCTIVFTSDDIDSVLKPYMTMQSRIVLTDVNAESAYRTTQWQKPSLGIHPDKIAEVTI